MGRKRKNGLGKPPERDLQLLLGLYKYRALTTEQIIRMYNYTRPYMYHKLVELRKKRLIISENVHGYIRNKNRQGKYHRIASGGLKLLKALGYEVRYIADDLRINRDRVPYLLSTNELIIELEDYGWSLMDSRETKKKYYINRNDNIHGVLRSKEGKEYPFYVFITTISRPSKIVNEIMRYDFRDMIIFTKTEESFEQAIELFGSNSDIVKYCTFRIFPYAFAKHYLRDFDNPSNLMNYLEERSDIELIGMSISRHTGLKTVVDHQGEEKYFVNLLDNDLEKVYQIKRYRRENYEQDGRRVLVITNSKLIDKHKEILEHVHHVDYLVISNNEMTEYLSAL